MQDWWIITGITVIYLIVILLVGLMARNEQSSSLEGYVAGDRSLGIFILFFIMGAEVFSAFAFLGGPGWTYGRGAPGFYILAYLGLGLLPWWVLGPKAARLGRKYGYLTQADLLSDRFTSRWLSAIIAIVSVGAFIPYLTIQITGAGILFEASTDGNVPFWLGSLAAFLIVTIYVYASGLRGIGWTNVIQGTIMIVVAWLIGLRSRIAFTVALGRCSERSRRRLLNFLPYQGLRGWAGRPSHRPSW
jgi:SSS family solute:Na+ symporter